MGEETMIRVKSDADIVAARSRGRSLAQKLGFTGTDLVLIATTLSELARNLIEHAGEGVIVLGEARNSERQAIVIVARDEGPGIPNLELAMQDGYSTKRSLGLGLPGVKRMMDEFEISSTVGQGTTIVAKKWTK